MTRHLLIPPRRLLRASIWETEELPGSAKAQLIVDDSSSPGGWIVKSIRASQGDLVSGDQAAFNDYVGSRIAEAAGFSVGEVGIMRMDDEFLDGYKHLRNQSHGSFIAGEHFAVKYYPGSQTLDYYFSALLRAELRAKCINPWVVNEVVAFDSGLSNWDRSIPMQGLSGENPKNLLIRPARTGGGLEIVIIDQGYCFAANWNTMVPPVFPSSLGAWPNEVFGVFHTLAKLNMYDQNEVLVKLGMLQSLTVADINSIIQEVPASWLGFTTSAQLTALVSALTHRLAGYARIITGNLTSVRTHAMVKV
ncbi:HipA family kinase [Deinococcus gobiensis]|uniref:HipA-like kinase domain-containing protein n=1 Tax=Deinococcus gobiensis (strain DSM 21396 / JCM 16679 / CGMCC 1.7299 / I-0) TaxID=745776 RepID=H8GXE7_DEIGI|nr:HipA family kinase [Deinococcus gobiensis]AFD25876.1 hypothetical protein DGo_CA1949 [Deinococcus gobiensis I-0]